MWFTLDGLAGTFTDAACRLETSETSLLSRRHTPDNSVTVPSGLGVIAWTFFAVVVA
jgi:hypothetical protein